MLRTAFEHDLQQLRDEILILGSEVEENLVRSVDALKQGKLDVARQLIAADEPVNQKRIKIGMKCFAVIATQQPIAGDMRTLAAVIEIAGELERIHDYVKGIAKITLMLSKSDADRPQLPLLEEMAEFTRRMLNRALVAFADGDAELALAIPPDDDKVDKLYKKTHRQIIDFILEQPQTLEAVNLLEWALHNLERAADRVTNICEWIVYMSTGVFRELDSEFEAPPKPTRR